MGVGGVAAGYLSDRFGTRAVVLTGGVVLGLGLVLSSLVREVWQFYVTFGVLVGAGVSAFYVPLTVLAIKWFDDRRGMAAAIVSAGNGLGILALSPLSRWLIDEFDWRVAFVILGDLAWLIVIPCAILLRPPPTSPQPTAARGEPVAAPTIGSVLGAWPIWAIALTNFACCAAHSGPIFHLVSHAIDQGVGSMAAASILGVSGLTSIVGRVGAGIVSDRLGGKRTLISMLVAQAALIPLYLVATSDVSLWGVSIVFGVAYGGAMPLYAVITREYFGEAIMGMAYGWVFFISCIGMGLGSFAGGAIHDALAPTGPVRRLVRDWRHGGGGCRDPPAAGCRSGPRPRGLGGRCGSGRCRASARLPLTDARFLVKNCRRFSLELPLIDPDKLPSLGRRRVSTGLPAREDKRPRGDDPVTNSKHGQGRATAADRPRA